MMRVPAPSEPNSTFPTYQVPQVSAMRGRAPSVQVARVTRGIGADPPSGAHSAVGANSVIFGSSCSITDNSNLRMQSVTDNCLLNSVTVPNKQRNDHTVAHNNSDKLVSKFGALLLGQDIPNQKADNLELNELNLTNVTMKYLDNDMYDTDDRFVKMKDMHIQDIVNRGDIYYPPLRLRGGGESSIGSSTTGWGTPPTQQANNGNVSGNKNNSNITNGQQPPTSQPNNAGWGPASNKQAAASSATSSASNNTTNSNLNNTQGQPTNSTKQQLEQLTNMRESILSHDGWGGQHVNQDTNWDIPSSPEPQLKMDGSGAPPWKPTVNNGTELWEANLRNGGQPPPQPQQKAPWGHTPSTNIGGTWGEDDDVSDASNVWTGVPPAQQQWGGGSSTTNNGAAMWGGPKKENDWGPGTGSSAGWGDHRVSDPRASAIDQRDMRPDLRDIRAANADPMRMLDPQQMRLVSGGDMRGDPRGITGRLNGAGAEAFWGQAGPQAAATHHMHQPKMTMPPGGTGGWEEPSPPSQRRNMPNYDDGTSLWGNPQPGSHWKDLPTGGSMGRSGAGGPPGMAQARMKQDGSVWSHARNGSWDDGSQGWDEAGPWPKPKTIPGQLWDGDNDWVHKPTQKPPVFTKEIIWNSKQFRMLVDMGYKKEDVENALRHRDMNMDEALDLLDIARRQNIESWRGRHDDHYDHQQFTNQRYPSGPSSQMGFPHAATAPSLLNNINSASAGANSSLINNMSPAIVQKMLSQSNGAQGFGSANPVSRSMQPPSQPSTAQLRMLVQQIQMAVHAGYLNHQILNQPLAPHTLVLLNQLLQQIKTLQQLASQQNMSQQNQCLGKPMLQYSVLITKAKQQIHNLQNQIAAQQAIYVKQQQQQQQLGSGGGPADIFKSNTMHDSSINALQSNFSDLCMNKDTQMNQPQSRLNQWKLPALDKEEGGEFSRAPGSVSKSLTPAHNSPNLNPLGLTQPDGPWSNGGRSTDTGWPDSSANDSAPDVKDTQWGSQSQTSLTDLVPEFEPGKPWKGTQLKSIEDDPSITPGSVVRSLSIATIKDTELFNMNSNKSPPLGDVIPSIGLNSSTWSFNPPSSTTTMITSPQNKLPATKGTLGDLNTATSATSNLWSNTKPRGPPPGLSTKGGTVVNGWNLSSNTSAPWSSSRNNWGTVGPSAWLLLRNLTAQIDGSTLRTLCLQHGPLQSFHLYLHQGFALAKYSSREEATKAQTALNNCVLGNTSILAENPNDWEASFHLQEVASQQGSSGTWRGSTKQVAASDTWSTGWPNASSASLWGSTPLDTGDQSRTTPSSLNSFLPGDLLGGESM